MFGVEGLDEEREDGRALDGDDVVEVDFDAERAGALVDLAVELGGLFLAALDLLGVFNGVLVSISPPAVKLNSLIGDTEDLLLARDFLADAVFLLEVGRFLLVEAELFFLIGVGVVLALDVAFGLGVPLMGFEALFAGVGVCLAIVTWYIYTIKIFMLL